MKETVSPRHQLPAPSELGECAFGDVSQHHSGNAGKSDYTPPRIQDDAREPEIPQELPPATVDDAIRGLNGIFRELQETFHDQWNWIDAAFYLEVIKSCIREPLLLYEAKTPPPMDSETECVALKTTCPHCHAPVDARCVSLHWAYRDDRWTPQYVYRQPHAKRLIRAQKFAWRKGEAIETTARS